MKKIALPSIIVVAVLLFDLATKHLIRIHLTLYEVIPITPFLDIVHFRNKGAAFGMLASLGNPFFITISIVAAVAIVTYMVKVKRDRLIMASVLGGALGNMIDRISLGYVTDFVYLHVGQWYWPAFNVADSALSIGIFLLVVSSLRSPGDKEQTLNAPR